MTIFEAIVSDKSLEFQAVKKPLGTNTKSNIPDIETVGTVPVTEAVSKPPAVSKQTKRLRPEEQIPNHWKDEMGLSTCLL